MKAQFSKALRIHAVTFGAWLLTSLLAPAFGQSGISIYRGASQQARPPYTCNSSVEPEYAPHVRWPNAEYTETNIDLKLKVPGGSVDIARSWQQGRWYLNAAWAPLDFELDPLGSSVKVIGRAGVLYERTGGSDVYITKGAQLEPVYIKSSVSGWQWYDRLGNTIDYDTKGRVVSYSRPTGLKVEFAYDSANQARILDAQGTTLYTIAMSDGVATSVTDRTGRIVSYQWSGTKDTKRLDAVTDIRGNVWKYKYDANGQLISRADPAGDTTTVSYAQSIPAPKSSLALGTEGLRIDPSTGSTLKLKDVWSAARVGNFVDCLGTITGSVEWIRKIRLFKVVITDNKGNSKTFYYPPGVGVDVEMGSESFDSYGNLLAKSIWDGKYQQRYTNERGEITVTNYNFNYQPVSIIYADGSIEKNEYEEVKGLQVKNINALGVVTEWKYDSKGSVIEQIEALGTPVQRKTVWEYDQWGQPTKRTLGEGADAIVWQYRYDAYGNVAEMTDSVGDIWKYSYTAAGDVATETDPLGRITKYEYDAGGNQIKVTSPKGYEIRTAYNSINLPSELTDALGRKSQIAYNNQGQITSVTNAKGESAKYTFNAYGNPTTETTPAGNTTKFEHDKKGRVTALVDPASNRITFEHGDNGTPQADVMTAMVLPGGTRQEFKYDQRGRTTLVTLKATGLDPVSESTTYDALGQIVASTNAAGHTSVAEYDALGRTTKITDAAGNSTLVTYNLLDQATSVTDALGNVHRFSYDKAGQLLEKTRPEGGKTRYQYDKAGQLTHVTDADGNQTAYTYDEDGNVTQQSRTSAASSALSQTVSYAYDANGDLTGYTQKGSLGEVISKASYTLDVLGRVNEETVTYGEGASAITRTFTREWDADWNTTSIGYDNRKTVAEYASGQLKNIKTPDGKQIQITKYNWMYPQTIQYPGSTRTQSYDGFFRPSEIDVKSSKSQTLLKLGYQYTKNSNIASQSVEQQGLIGKIDYQYDTLDRLTQAAPSQALVDFGLPNEGYGYDAVGNRTSSNHQAGPWQYATGNRLIQKGDTSYTYTASGHVQTATRAGITRNYVYDGAQRVVQVSEAGKNIAIYQYDPAGRRINKTVGDGASSQTTWYVYDAEGLSAEIDAAGATVKSYGWVPGAPWGTSPVWQQDHLDAQTKGYHFLHPDHLERPLAASDGTGAATWQVLSESFGRAHIENDSTTNINLRFPGQYWDAEVGTHYNQQRDFDPETGRYIQPDPLDIDGGINIYSYSYENPLSYTDPTGEVVPALIYNYARCVARCKIKDAILSYVTDSCDPRTLGDCALECLNPFNWFGKKSSDNVKQAINRGVQHSTRKRALEASKHAHGGKLKPTPSKNSPKEKRDRYKDQQKYLKPERHQGSAHPEGHFHEGGKATNPVNTHHSWGGRTGK